MIILNHPVFAKPGAAERSATTLEKRMLSDTEANQRLAELMGWTHVFVAGTALMGTPPAGGANCRGQARVPDWTGGWAACGPLIGQFSIAIDPMSTCISAAGIIERYAGIDRRDAALRRAIVLAAIGRIERQRAREICDRTASIISSTMLSSPHLPPTGATNDPR